MKKAPKEINTFLFAACLAALVAVFMGGILVGYLFFQIATFAP